jgi:hypothetical protein
MFASSPAAIIRRTDGTRRSATASWIFGAGPGRLLLDSAALDAAERGGLLAKLIGERRTVAARTLDHASHRGNLPHRRIALSM